ncbi:unnamed protein product [Rotaria socialis]|uniref:Uncharacterized protein n=5 Tax=Rotaria TaxID=231623 RepID=A0A818QCR9_9BILA|nr:unnamed protein product [Rotaria socialis]CAF3563345.1 unnamed protein product [Rotaria socialis]CAF3634559.1 unnamed protein product [Rotaria socialis]CAF3682753.1 unnamed protein product [Rotaria socialis]CAF3781870.1 unnamed protein product [Rotaria socialis]
MAEKKKKKGGGKKKKTGENVYEALLEYKVSIVDKELEDWRFRVFKLEEENETLKGRDAHLREECETTMKTLVSEALQFDKENINYPKVGKEDVNAALHDKMDAAAHEEAELREIHDQMFNVEVEIFKARCKIKQWTKYRDVTCIEEERAIQSLEREVAYMIDNYVVLSKYLEKNTKEERLALTQMAQDKIEQKTRAATERVAMGLDRFTKKMLSENQYMTRELSLREQELIDLEEHVRTLEQTNLAINERLNTANITDATNFTNTFMTEIYNNDMATNVGNNSLLAVDLGQLTIRSDISDKTFEQLLNELDLNTSRLPAIEDEDTIVSPMASLHIEGTHMHVQLPPVLNEEEEKCLDFKGPTWIGTARLKQALRKA